MRNRQLSVVQACGALLLFVAGLVAPAQAQRTDDRDERLARFRWEGVVDGTTLIRVSRRRVDYEYSTGLPVQRQNYDFTDPLPSTRVEVRLNVIEGRGDIRLIQQPREDNNYVAIVRIDDRDRGTGNYSFELLWERPLNNDGRRDRDEERFEWRGRVDGESIIRVRSGSTRIENIRGNGVSDEQYHFSNRSGLPDQRVQVSLVETSGRGEIVLLEQPDRRNDFTASVRIRDYRGGTGRYSFTLTWQQPRYRPPDRERPGPGDSNQPFGVGLQWSGRVDGTDLLRIRGDQLSVDHQAGVPVTGADYRLLKPLPYSQRDVTVRKIRGRGRVTVIEQPSRANNFTATILIEDKDGGSGQYEIEVSW
ncbi:MAG TPA: hypothetical protein VFD58_33165 [Blastocatellia bacterium]|nr:hypothetical protein [Blastocatellia bacterium]